MANTGLRRREALQARRRHVVGGCLRILSERKARTKSGKWREVPLTAAAKTAIDELAGTDYLLTQIEPESLSRIFSREAKAQGLMGTLHTLRHTFCSHLVMAGVPLRTVQILAGHANYKTTKQYAHLAPDHLKDAIAGFSL